MCVLKMVSNAAGEKKKERSEDLGEYGIANAEGLPLNAVGTRRLSSPCNLDCLCKSFAQGLMSLISNCFASIISVSLVRSAKWRKTPMGFFK